MLNLNQDMRYVHYKVLIEESIAVVTISNNPLNILGFRVVNSLCENRR